MWKFAVCLLGLAVFVTKGKSGVVKDVIEEIRGQPEDVKHIIDDIKGHFGVVKDIIDGISGAETSDTGTISAFKVSPCSVRYFCYDNRHYYIETQNKRTRDDAAKHCTALNMELANLETCDEDSYITNLLKKSSYCGTKSYWISATHSGNNIWSWQNGLPVEFSNWKLGEPSSKKERYCAMYRNDFLQWKDEPCKNKHYYICESVHPCA